MLSSSRPIGARIKFFSTQRSRCVENLYRISSPGVYCSKGISGRKSRNEWIV